MQFQRSRSDTKNVLAVVSSVLRNAPRLELVLDSVNLRRDLINSQLTRSPFYSYGATARGDFDDIVLPFLVQADYLNNATERGRGCRLQSNNVESLLLVRPSDIVRAVGRESLVGRIVGDGQVVARAFDEVLVGRLGCPRRWKVARLDGACDSDKSNNEAEHFGGEVVLGLQRSNEAVSECGPIKSLDFWRVP